MTEEDRDRYWKGWEWPESMERLGVLERLGRIEMALRDTYEEGSICIIDVQTVTAYIRGVFRRLDELEPVDLARDRATRDPEPL